MGKIVGFAQPFLAEIASAAMQNKKSGSSTAPHGQSPLWRRRCECGRYAHPAECSQSPATDALSPVRSFFSSPCINLLLDGLTSSVGESNICLGCVLRVICSNKSFAVSCPCLDASISTQLTAYCGPSSSPSITWENAPMRAISCFVAAEGGRSSPSIFLSSLAAVCL